jgi:hypothetical protein
VRYVSALGDEQQAPLFQADATPDRRYDRSGSMLVPLEKIAGSNAINKSRRRRQNAQPLLARSPLRAPPMLNAFPTARRLPASCPNRDPAPDRHRAASWLMNAAPLCWITTLARARRRTDGVVWTAIIGPPALGAVLAPHWLARALDLCSHALLSADDETLLHVM